MPLQNLGTAVRGHQGKRLHCLQLRPRQRQRNLVDPLEKDPPHQPPHRCRRHHQAPTQASNQTRLCPRAIDQVDHRRPYLMQRLDRWGSRQSRRRPHLHRDLQNNHLQIEFARMTPNVLLCRARHITMDYRSARRQCYQIKKKYLL